MVSFIEQRVPLLQDNARLHITTGSTIVVWNYWKTKIGTSAILPFPLCCFRFFCTYYFLRFSQFGNTNTWLFLLEKIVQYKKRIVITLLYWGFNYITYYWYVSFFHSKTTLVGRYSIAICKRQNISIIDT